MKSMYIARIFGSSNIVVDFQIQESKKMFYFSYEKVVNEPQSLFYNLVQLILRGKRVINFKALSND